MRQTRFGVKRLGRWVVAMGISTSCIFASIGDAYAQSTAEALLTAGQGFADDDPIVSTSVFLWYTPTGGQISGPWDPVGGRASWTGEVPFWKDQIKQIMSANIDVMYVHMIGEESLNQHPTYAAQRVKFFEALGELRHEGFDVPNVSPFLDPLITWGFNQPVNVGSAAGKDRFVQPYHEFFDQYFGANADAFAESYLAAIDGKVVLDTWHTEYSLFNASALTRADVESRLQARHGAAHPLFDGGIYMVATDGNALSFEDEQVVQFQSQAYYDPTVYNGRQTVQLKPGYWDQNIRDPGFFLRRNGGALYAEAWNRVLQNKEVGVGIDRVYIESWNEYDEGSGIYPAKAEPPIINNPPNDAGNTDVWSSSGDPYEYVRTTAAGAAQFNDVQELDSSILWHNIPASMRPGEKFVARVIVRNQGDASWSGADDYQFGQNLDDPVAFAPQLAPVDDAANEVSTYGGVFRGRPVEFRLELTAPLTQGSFGTEWQMTRGAASRFGDQLDRTINVSVVASTNNLLINGDFEGNAEGVVTGGQDVIDPSSIRGWRTFGVAGAVGTATVKAAAGRSGKGIELVRRPPTGGDAGFDKDASALREPILKEQRIYMLTVDARDGGPFAGTPQLALEVQFADGAYNRTLSYDPGPQFETFGLTARSDAGGSVSTRFSLPGGAGRSVHLDNARLIDVTTGVNRVVNGDFENSATNLLNWRLFQSGGAAGSATLSNDANGAGRAVLLNVATATPTGDATLDLGQSRVAVLPGEQLRFAFASKIFTASGADARLRASVVGFDANGVAAAELLSALVAPATTGYDAFTFDFQVPANVHSLNLAFRSWDVQLGGAAPGQYLIDDVSISRIMSVGLGDFNQDFQVDGSDFLIWQRGQGAPGGIGQGDANGDGVVDDGDLRLWQSSFGFAGQGAGPASAVVPEPCAGMLCATSWLLLRFASRRRQITNFASMSTKA